MEQTVSCASVYIDFIEFVSTFWDVFILNLYEEDKKVDLEEIIIDDYDHCDDFY